MHILIPSDTPLIILLLPLLLFNNLIRMLIIRLNLILLLNFLNLVLVLEVNVFELLLKLALLSIQREELVFNKRLDLKHLVLGGDGDLVMGWAGSRGKVWEFLYGRGYWGDVTGG